MKKKGEEIRRPPLFAFRRQALRVFDKHLDYSVQETPEIIIASLTCNVTDKEFLTEGVILFY